MSLYGYLAHYGAPRHSGRYPWGSGDRPYQSGGGPFAKKKKHGTTSVVVTSNRGETKSVTIPKQKNATNTVKATAREVYRTRDQFTNDEIKAIVDRLEKEQRLIDIGTPKKSLGQKWVENVLSDYSKRVVSDALTGMSEKALTELGIPVKQGGKKKK